jgi:hypothetical protein
VNKKSKLNISTRTDDTEITTTTNYTKKAQSITADVNKLHLAKKLLEIQHQY